MGVNEAGLSQSMNAAMYLKTNPNQKIDLPAPVYDPDRNLLLVQTIAGEDLKSLYEIIKIDLTPK